MPNREYNSFLQAFEKFKHLRGVRPILVRSDNEKTFLTSADQEKLRNQCFETEWRINPPQSPNFGGTYECLIKMVKEKYAQCFNRQRFDSISDFEVAISYLEYIINNRPLFTQKDPITQKIVVIRPSHFIHPGHPDQFDHEMSNLFSARTEMASKEGLLEQTLTRLNKFKKRLKLLFDKTYVNMLCKVHLNKLYSRKENCKVSNTSRRCCIDQTDSGVQRNINLHKNALANRPSSESTRRRKFTKNKKSRCLVL